MIQILFYNYRLGLCVANKLEGSKHSIKGSDQEATRRTQTRYNGIGNSSKNGGKTEMAEKLG